ncbi:MAG: CapA family protein, partial [Pseudonocardiales bacterium]
MTPRARPNIPRRRRPAVWGALALAVVAALVACTSGVAKRSAAATHPHPPSNTSHSATPAARSTPVASPTRPAGEFTIAFAGDVHFADRVGTRLASNPATVFAQAATGLAKADLTMVNLETAITTGGDQQAKSFTFRAPPTAFTALKDAGVDVATMANNHGADYGAAGLADTLAAIRQTRFPVVGIGRNAAAAYAPFTTTVNGTKIAILAATQVHDETLANFSAGPTSAGVANAFSEQLLAGVRAAKAAGRLVVVYLHWGTEYDTCPNPEQRTLADQLAAAGASAVIGTHAHVLQGAGWRADGTYVAYGLGNYLWWMSFGNNQ